MSHLGFTRVKDLWCCSRFWVLNFFNLIVRSILQCIPLVQMLCKMCVLQESAVSVIMGSCIIALSIPVLVSSEASP